MTFCCFFFLIVACCACTGTCCTWGWLWLAIRGRFCAASRLWLFETRALPQSPSSPSAAHLPPNSDTRTGAQVQCSESPLNHLRWPTLSTDSGRDWSSLLMTRKKHSEWIRMTLSSARGVVRAPERPWRSCGNEDAWTDSLSFVFCFFERTFCIFLCFRIQ